MSSIEESLSLNESYELSIIDELKEITDEFRLLINPRLGNENKETNVMKRNLQIKYLCYTDNNKLQTSYIGLKSFIKFFDFRIPIESTFLHDDYSKQEKFPILFDNSDFIRISKVTYIIDKKEFTIDSEYFYPLYSEKEFNSVE